MPNPTEEQKYLRFTALRQISINQLECIERIANESKDNSSLHSKFKVTFKNLKKIVKDFEKNHYAIIGLVAADESLVTSENLIHTDFSERCSSVQTIYHDLFELEINDLTNLNQSISTTTRNDHAILPKIKLPTFAGDFENFAGFLELFNALVHNSNALSDIEKFNYLLSVLSGPPLTLIKNIKLLGDNYHIAYNTLIKRYDNKRLRAVSCWKAIEGFFSLNKDNVSSLRNLVDTFEDNLASLKNMGYEPSDWDFILANMLLDRLDPATQKAFEQYHASNDMPNYNNIIKFVTRQCTALESLDLNNTTQNRTKHFNQNNNTNYPRGNYRRNSSALLLTQQQQQQQSLRTASNACFLCGEPHIIYKCSIFLSKTPFERINIIKNNKACINCLANAHTILQCTSLKRCKTCNKNHHSLLHLPFNNNNGNNAITFQNSNFAQSNNNNNRGQPRTNPCENVSRVPLANTTVQNSVIQNAQNDSHLHHNLPSTSTDTVDKAVYMLLNDHEVLLSTILLKIKDTFGNWHQARAILDSGAQSTFITKKLSNKLGLSKYNVAINLQGLETMCTSARSGVCCTIMPLSDENISFDIEAIVIEKICDSMPRTSFDSSLLPLVKNLKLSDPGFNQKGEVDLLLGADIFGSILVDGKIHLGQNYPTFLNTVFGWTLMGKVPITSSNFTSKNIQSLFTTSIQNELDISVKRFWEIEEVPEVVSKSPEDKYCEKYFVDTTKQSVDGKYVVALPFKIAAPDFGDTKPLALRRFYSLEKRLLHDKNMHCAYSDVLREYLQLGHMERVSDSSSLDSDQFYIPHHAVQKKDSTSTPLRVVFDASSHAPNKLSLNEALYAGPKLQADLLKILLNFRIFKYVFTCDIKQMFRMILVKPEHRKYQKILWRFSPEEDVCEYQLNTVTFGVASSPYLAIRTLRQLANDHTDLPLASSALLNATYVDDIATGDQDFDEVVKLKDDLITLLKRGGFELRKWASNEPKLLSDLPESYLQTNDFSLDLENDTTLKILGLRWNPGKDNFFYSFDNVEKICTKRNILSELARIFDPAGYLTPVVLSNKLILQHLWSLGLKWDDTPPEDVVVKWKQFKAELQIFSNFSIPRHIDIANVQSCQVIGFSDASEKAYAAVVYFRILYENNSPNSFLVCAKSKVAPLKRITLPRLELCAAVLLSKLLQFTLNTFEKIIKFEKVLAFTDSKVTLSWIQSSPHRWKSFVSNRVTYIQENLAPEHWYYVPSALNPADCASRGLSPKELSAFSLWWQGPDFLKTPIEKWNFIKVQHASLPEAESEGRKVVLSTTAQENHFIDNLYQKFSSLSKIKKIIAYILRFLHNVKNKNNLLNSNLSYNELHNALLVLVKHDQNLHFQKYMSLLVNEEPLPKNLRKLDPFLDEQNILRVGGRLRNSELEYDRKFPILLPSDSTFTELLIYEIHEKFCHAGIQTTHCLLSQNFWILGAKRVIRKIIFRCHTCWRTHPKPYQPKMGDLPKFRISQAKAFENVGIDLTGHFLITMNRLRGSRTLKAYVCLFICCTTKAVHLELLSELSSESFLAGFRRFIARRGRCSNVYTDNGTNFVGAAKYLKEIYLHTANVEVIKWHFNPPSAPHMGGIWESNIKSMKSHLQRVIGNQILSYEEFYTVLTQVEAVLNSRPLCPISSDPNDLSALTPGHFLSLESLTSLPDPDLNSCKLNRLSRWQLLQRIHSDFWRRWHREYLHTLQQRGKWNSSDNLTIAPGIMVIIKTDDTSPLNWPLGRVQEVVYGKDKIARVAVVKTAKGLLKRPLVKLCPLPNNS